MLDRISGIVIELSETKACIQVGPICLEITIVSMPTSFLNKEICLYTYLHWNQETGPQLFGFQTATQRSFFLQIIQCSGMGPKIALALLAQMSLQEFIRSITVGDARSLSKVNGIGIKKAEQLIVQLKHKIETLQELSGTDTNATQGASVDTFRELAQALNSLHYSRSEINQAIQHVQQKGADQSFDQLLRFALSFLSKT